MVGRHAGATTPYSPPPPRRGVLCRGWKETRERLAKGSGGLPPPKGEDQNVKLQKDVKFMTNEASKSLKTKDCLPRKAQNKLGFGANKLKTNWSFEAKRTQNELLFTENETKNKLVFRGK